MKLIFVCGPWSSGTTAVSGMLDALGLDGCGPFFRTNDVRTPNSFESQAFRAVVDSVFSEETLQPKVSAQAARAALVDFRASLLATHGPQPAAEGPRIFLKYPLASLLIPQICQVFDTRLVYVLRPLREIEATRTRRNWTPNLGAAGAATIYSRMFDNLLNLPHPTLIVRYPELLADPEAHARRLADFAGTVQPSDQRLQATAAFIRQAKA